MPLVLLTPFARRLSLRRTIPLVGGFSKRARSRRVIGGILCFLLGGLRLGDVGVSTEGHAPL